LLVEYRFLEPREVIMRRALPLLLLCALPACMPGAGIAPERDSFGATISVKQVATKREPDTLLARDASVCRVSEERFRATEVGELVRCAWRPAA
jgi:hypothetical protein